MMATVLTDETVVMDRLMAEFRQGNSTAAGQLVELLYPQLRHMARSRMNRERNDHTWQPTALINEVYLELLKVRNLPPPAPPSPNPQAAFLGFVSHLMFRLLVRHSRRLARRVERIPLGADETAFPAQASLEDHVGLESLMSRLESINPRLRSVVEMRVCEGLSGDEIAQRLGCTRRTVIRDWNFAKQFLAAEYTLSNAV